MKRLAAALLLLFTALALAEDAPVESVTAYGSSLAGVWRLSNPDYVAMTGFFSPLKWGPLREIFCRIAPGKENLEMHCPTGWESTAVTAEGSHVHFAWGTMLLRLAIDGELESPSHFRGHFQIKLSGITYENPAFSEAVKMAPDQSAPDKAGKAALLRRILDGGLTGVPHDEAAMKKNGPVSGAPELGAVTAITYLGQNTRWSGPAPAPDGKPGPDHIPDQPDFFSVYLVTAAQGERLCSLHQRDDGVLDAFRCV